MIEKGARGISDRTIRDICKQFNVNESWLRDGSEQMYSTDNEITEIAKIYKLNENQVKYLKDFNSLTNIQQKIVLELVRSMI